MSEIDFEQLRENMKQKDLLNQATLVEVDEGKDGNRFNHVNLLCKTMVDAAKTGPVKAEYGGNMFVVDKGATIAKTLQAWKEQVEKPFIETLKPDALANTLRFQAGSPYIDDKAQSYSQAAMVEILVTKYPEYTDKISMLQLLNAFEKSTRKNIDAIGKTLIQNTKRFINGEETFPPTLENMAALEQNKDMLSFALSIGVNSYELKKRIQETELKMLKNLQPEDVSDLPDSKISAGLRIAQKHKDKGDFEKIFVKEIKNRLSQGKMYNPNDK